MMFLRETLTREICRFVSIARLDELSFSRRWYAPRREAAKSRMVSEPFYPALFSLRLPYRVFHG